MEAMAFTGQTSMKTLAPRVYFGVRQHLTKRSSRTRLRRAAERGVNGPLMTSVRGIITGSVAATFIATLGMGIFSSEVSIGQFASVVLVYSLIGSVVAIVSAFLIGWPLSLLFRRLGLMGWWQYCIGGAVCAFPFWFAWFYPFNTGHWYAYRASNSTYFYSVGAIAGFIYWWYVVRPINKYGLGTALQRPKP